MGVTSTSLAYLALLNMAQTAPDSGEIEVPAASVFHIGHSMVNTVMPQILQSIARSRGHTHSYDSQVVNGASLHSGWTDSRWTVTSTAREVIPRGQHDVVVMIENLVPDGHQGWYTDGTMPYARRFRDLAMRSRPGTRTFYYQPWFNRDDPSFNWRIRTDEERPYFEAIMGYVNSSTIAGPPMQMIPVGRGVVRIYEEIQAGLLPGLTSIDDIFSDAVHMNYIGDYFVALMHYAVIYRRSPVGASNWSMYQEDGWEYPRFVEPRLARRLQEIAWAIASTDPSAGIRTETPPLPALVTRHGTIQNIAGGPSGPMTALESLGNEIYVGTAGRGLYVYNTQTRAWRNANYPLVGAALDRLTPAHRALLAGPSHGLHILSLHSDGQRIYLGTRGAGVYALDEQRRQWQLVGGPRHSFAAAANTIHQMSSYGPTLRIATNAGVWHTRSTTVAWQADSSGIDASQAVQLLVDKSGLEYISQGNTIYRKDSTDAAWIAEPALPIETDFQVQALSFYRQHLYVATSAGVFFKDRRQPFWQPAAGAFASEGQVTAFANLGGILHLLVSQGPQRGLHYLEPTRGGIRPVAGTSGVHSAQLVVDGNHAYFSSGASRLAQVELRTRPLRLNAGPFSQSWMVNNSPEAQGAKVFVSRDRETLVRIANQRNTYLGSTLPNSWIEPQFTSVGLGRYAFEDGEEGEVYTLVCEWVDDGVLGSCSEVAALPAGD